MIYKKLFQALTLLVSIVIMIGVCGCMNLNNNTVSFNVDEIISYMNNKYGEEFSFIETTDESQPRKYSLSIFVCSNHQPSKRILAECRITDSSNEKVFSDNYDSIKYEEQTRKYFTEIVTKVYPNAKVRYNIEPLISTSTLNVGAASFDEYLSTCSSLSFTVLIEPNHSTANKDAELETLCNILCDKKAVCNFSVRYSDDSEAFETFNVEEYEPFSQQFSAIGSVIINNNYEVSSLDWR